MRPSLCPLARRASQAAFLALFVALFGTSAFAQATRTWVSGVGDDANPCSRTAPCRSFSGALPKTAAGGEIDALDPGDFGAVTVTKAVTLNGARSGARLVATTGTGITVNAAGAAVILRNLRILGTDSASTGIHFIAGASLHLEDVSVAGFTRGISFDPNNGGALFLRQVSVDGNAAEGAFIGSESGTASAVIERSSFHRNAVGLLAGAGAKVTVRGGALGQNADAGVALTAGASGAVDLNVEGTVLIDNGVGVASSAVGGVSTARLSKAMILGNALGSTALEGEGSVLSFGNNRLVGGSRPGCPADAIQLAPSALPAGTQDVAYPSTPFTAYGALGSPGFTESGALPTGMTFTHGALTGTPTEHGLYPLTVQSTDGNGCTTAAALELLIACPGVTLGTTTVMDGATGVAYAPVTFTEVGGSGTLSWSEDGALPIGMTFDGGTLSGVPTEPGSFPFTVTVEDSAGCPALGSYVLFIAQSPGFQPTTLALTAAPATPAFGDTVTVTATLTTAGDAPAGTVTLFEGETSLGSAPLSGKTAVFTLNGLLAGDHALSAIYSGDTTFGGSRAPALPLTVTPAATGTALTAQPSSGGATLIAQVSSTAGTPEGTVSFWQDTTSLGSATLDDAGTATLAAALAPGSYSLIARYAGSPSFAPSDSSPVTFTVQADTPDGGTSSQPDGGTQGAPPADSGCGCSQSGGGYSFALAMLALWGLGRRKRRWS